MTHLLTTPSKFELNVDRTQYPLPWAVGMKLVWSALWGKRLSFARDARACVFLLDPSLKILGSINIPQHGPCLVIANHYSRPGFQAWWIALAISASLLFEVHWVMTGAWRFERRPFSRQLEALTQWGFKRAAQVYGFTTFPPMPPNVEETEARAQAVRRLLSYARQVPRPVIGLVPEGNDTPGSVLGKFPTGAGRLVAHLLPYSHRILPVAVYEESGHLNLNFGKTFTVETPTHTNPESVDRITSNTLMHAIASLLPTHLRGAN